MDFSLGETRTMLKESLDRALADHAAALWRHPAGSDLTAERAQLHRILAELGAPAALVAEADGGLGGDGFDIAVVFEALGRALAVTPLLASAVVAGGLLARLGGPRPLIERIVAGDLVASLAHDEAAARYDLTRVATRAVPADDGWRLDGAKIAVPFAEDAEVLLISARTSGAAGEAAGLSVFVVDPGAAGVTRRGTAAIDGGPLGEVVLDGAAGRLVGEAGTAHAALEEVRARAIVAVTAEAVGAMERARDMTVEYLKTRRQFGQPIGRFQALQHRMAEMAIEIEQARSAVINAAGHLGADRLTRELKVSAAKHLVGETARLVAEEAIQMHGGMGMTWDYPLGHYARRLVMIDHLFGDSDHHLARYSALQRGRA